jgi:hypothetical protein
VTVTWASGVIRRQWLQVTTKATAATGLLQSDVFYFGNSVGEIFNSTTDTRVNALDISFVRLNMTNNAVISSRFDCNRDRSVNSADINAVRLNLTIGSAFLQLISTPSAAPVGPIGFEH